MKIRKKTKIVATLGPATSDEEIIRLDNILDSPNDHSEEEINAAEIERASLKLQIANTLDIYIVFDLPRPCVNDPTGKCVPSRLEYIIFPIDIQQAAISVASKDGQIEGVSDDLQPLPGFESELQFIRIPIEDVESALTLELAWKDSKGNPTSITVVREN